jgi:O-succinylbenzoate synthase
MLRIERIALREVRLPLREPFRISSGVVSERRIFLLELAEADGPVVWA